MTLPPEVPGWVVAERILLYIIKDCTPRDTTATRAAWWVEIAMSREKQPGPTTQLSLLQRARANDQQAWLRLVALYRPLILFWCRQAHCPTAEVEDVAQEVFAAVASGLGGFRRDRPGDSFRGWLRGITRNQVLLHFRRNQGRPQPEGGSEALERLQDVADPLLAPTEDEAVEASQLYRRAVEQVRGEFEEGTWQMFWRTVVEGRSPVALAEEVGVTAATVRQAKSRVLRRLKQEMGELLE
jgi:RNA polymerase sigma-70 factor (ECF subfamily)